MQLADAGEPAAALALCDAYEVETPGDPDVRLQRFYFKLLSDYEAIYHGLEEAVVEFPDIANSSCNGHKCCGPRGRTMPPWLPCSRSLRMTRATVWRNSIWLTLHGTE